jgi:hypothetical protein
MPETIGSTDESECAIISIPPLQMATPSSSRKDKIANCFPERSRRIETAKHEKYPAIPISPLPAVGRNDTTRIAFLIGVEGPPCV